MKSTRPLLPPTQDSHGFALISVLALVSLAALTATAFLASARLEKTAAMTTGDQTRLTLALDSGYHLASYVFTRGDNTWNWADFLVGEDTDGVGYLYHATPTTSTTTGEWTNYALFSCATIGNIGLTLFNPANWAATTIQQGGFASNRLTTTSQLCKMTNFSTTNVTPSGPVTRIPLLFSRTSPVVNWITNYVTNPSTGLLSPTFRFAYFTEDPSGLIDVDRMGGSTSRDTGTNPTEIALGEVGITNFGTFTNLRRLFLTPGMIEDVLRTNNVTNASVTNPWRYLSSSFYSMNGLKTDKPTRSQGYLRIPTGLGYNEADTNTKFPAKYNINTNSTGGLTNIPLSVIAAAITNNLRNFGTIRSGAMAPTAYISNIAANIVDYVDTDSTPTVDTDTNNVITTWRGVENIAWPNEVYTRFNLTERQTNLSASPPNYLFKLGVKQYIEVWNLSSTSVVVNGSDYSISNNLDIPLKCTNWNGNLKSADSTTPPASESCTNASFTLPANSYGVLSAGTRTFNILVPTNLANNTTTPMLTINPSTTANKYTISYKGKIIDATPGGRWLGFSTNMRVGDFHFITTAVNFGTSADGSAFNLAGGDPRGGLFVIQPAMDFSYNFTTPGGRNVDNNPKTVGGAKYVDPKVNWVDGGHSLGNSGADIATSPTSAAANNSIPQGPQKQGNTNHWVQKINNSGLLTNVMELGNIFDPIQWGDPNNPFHPRDTAAWMGLSNSATPFNGACGRNTLRIGRPEHQRFAWTNVSGQAQPNMQASAAALLDIFCADTNTDANILGRFDDGNQININTAPPRVLRALAAGVILNSDQAMKPSNNYSIPSNAITAFVTGVTNFRAKYPFYSASQLAFIGTNADWPNTNTWPAGAVFSTNVVKGTSSNFEWNDAAAEEWFSKIYALSKVQTRNYRIYVKAQLIRTRGTNTNVSALSFGTIARRYYDVLNQQNDANPPSCSTYLLRKVDY
jgi:hypothetical protein